MRRMFSEKQLKEMAQAETTALVEGGELENAKPIYCHPITLLGQSGNKTKLTMLIFNNTATAFDRNSFKSYLAGMPTARFMTSGFYDDGVEVHVASYITAQSTTSISFLGYGLTTGDIDSINIATDINDFLFYDGVNKIN